MPGSRTGTPKHRRKDSVARILGEAFDGGAAMPASSSVAGSRPTILRHGDAPTGDIAGLKRTGDCRQHVM